MKTWDIIDYRNGDRKKYTISHEGDACAVAREYCGKTNFLHLPTRDGESAVVLWVGTDSVAVRVKPAGKRDKLEALYITAKEEAERARRWFKLSINTAEEDAAFDNFKRKLSYFKGVADTIEAAGRDDMLKGGNL